MARAAIAAALLLLAAWQAASHPDCWAAEFAPDCFAVPTKPYACHKGPEVDKGTSLSVAGKVCAGKPFTLSAKFPTARHAYVTFSAGVVVANKNEFNVKCPNTFAQAPETGYKGVVSALPVAAVAPSKPGTMIRATVASSTGPCAPYLITSASFKVEAC